MKLYELTGRQVAIIVCAAFVISCCVLSFFYITWIDSRFAKQAKVEVPEIVWDKEPTLSKYEVNFTIKFNSIPLYQAANLERDLRNRCEEACNFGMIVKKAENRLANVRFPADSAVVMWFEMGNTRNDTLRWPNADSDAVREVINGGGGDQITFYHDR